MISKETAIKAATWWAQFLTTPGKMDAGDAMTNAFATYAGMTARANLEAEPEEIQAFIAHLAASFEGRRSTALGVDYQPDRVLVEALEHSGIGAGGGDLLPVKTAMWIEEGNVTARVGYDGQVEEI